MARIGTRSLLFAVDGEGWGGTGFRDFTDEVSKAVLLTVEAKRPRRLFEPDYEHGGMKEYRLGLTVAQDDTATSLWELARNNASRELPFYLAPHGNLVATDNEPHWTGTAFVVGPDGDFLGGEADKSRTAVLVSEMAWVVIDEPERIDAGEYPATPPEGW